MIGVATRLQMKLMTTQIMLFVSTQDMTFQKVLMLEVAIPGIHGIENTSYTISFPNSELIITTSLLVKDKSITIEAI